MHDQSSEDCFAGGYAQARGMFLAASARAGATMQAYRHPLPGPSGEDLFADVALLGPREADQLLIVVSGTHGVEGFCGSACQIALLDSGVFSGAAATSVLLVHAINPYGFAHLRRTNEDNVDLNRNFIDHGRSPQNPEYASLHPLLAPDDWDGPSYLKAEVALLRLMQERGLRAVYAAASRGQYTHRDGLFYGGEAPVWSNRTFRDIVERAAPGRSRIVHLDLHTGLGRYGYGEAIYVGAASDPGCRLLGDWLSEPVAAIFDGAAVAPQVDGPTPCAVTEAAGSALVMPFALEFGTIGLLPVLRAMRVDAWLNNHRSTPDDLARALRAEVRAAFNVDDPHWRAMVIDQVLRHGRELMRGLEERNTRSS